VPFRFFRKPSFKKKAKEEKPPRPPVTRRRVKPPTLREVFTAFALAFFEKPGAKLAKAFEFEKALRRAGLSIHPVKYGSETLALTSLAAVFSIASIVVALALVKPPLVTAIIIVLFSSLLPVIVFTIRLAYPSIKASARKSDTENELPFFMAYAATMVRGGYSLEKVVERVAALKVFKAIREEMRRVVTRMRMFGEDPVTALDAVASAHPSPRFRDIMLGYTTTLRSGGDVVHYLEIRTRELFEARVNEVRSILNRLASFLEVYIVFGVLVSITVFVFFAVQGAIAAAQQAQRGGEVSIAFDITTPMIYNFFALPLIGFAIMFAIHINQPRSPIGYGAVYATSLTFVPIAIASFIIALLASGGAGVFAGSLGLSEVKSLVIACGASFLTVSIPSWLRFSMLEKGHRGMVRATADFLRDLSEVRKTGLSPEKCIVLLSQRSYRTLTPVVTRASAALSIGFSLEDALRKALRGVREWFTVASFRFLADSIIVGGGSPEVIDTLARFTQSLSEMEEESRRRMRSQVILPYFGAVMLTTMPIIILYMLLTIAKVSVQSAAPLIAVMMLGGMVNSFIMGLIAGKASRATIAAGFMHSTILVLVTMISSLATLAYIGA
jgi:flagellar protein FlaJ